MKTTLLLTILLCAGLFCSSNSYANTYYWTGSSSSNWNTLGNWALSSCGGSTPTSLPGTGDSVVFSGSCSNNNCNINVSISILSFRIDNAYTGTVTQSSGNAITVAYGKFADGTFSGSGAAITFSSSLTIEGGTFTTTSGTTTLEGNFSYTGGTFNHNNGRIVFYKTLTVSGVNSSSSISLYDVEFQAAAGNSTITLNNIILNVADSTLLTGSNNLFINSSQTTSVINAGGEVKIYNTSGTGGGTSTIVVNGSSTQHLTGNATTEDVGKLPNLKINSTGTVYLIGFITMGGSTTLTYTAGTINVGTSKVVFYYDNTITGSMTFNNVEFQGTSSTCIVSNTITVNSNLYTTSTGQIVINTGTINLYGNFAISNTSVNTGGSATVNFTGTNNDSIIASSGVTSGEGYLPQVTLNKTGGTLYFKGQISLSGNWTNNYSTANINPGTANFYIYYPESDNTIGGTYSTPVWNAQFVGGNYAGYTIGEDSALIVKNNLTLSGSESFSLSGHSINVYGNIIASNSSGGAYGSTILNLVGSESDSIISPSGYIGGECYLPSITVNKTGGTLYLIGIVTLANWTNNYSETNINPGTSTVYFYGENTIGGSYRTPVWNAQFAGGDYDYYSIGEDSALIVKNNLTLSGYESFQFYNHSINIYGNIIASNNNGGVSGSSTVFNLVGSKTDSIISSSGYTLGECYLPAININKTGNTLTLIGNITEGYNWTYVNGTVNAGTSTVGMYGNGYTLTGATGSDTMSFNNVVIAGNTSLGSALKAAGNLTINSSEYLATTSSNYQITLAGNWINNGTYYYNSSNVTFNGSLTDSIKGSTNTTFYSLTLDKTGTVTLAEPAIVANSLNLTSGNMLTTSTYLLTLNNGSSVTGGSNNSFVNGPIKKIGNSAFTFPTGAGSSYHPISITAPSSTSDAFTAQYFNSAPSSRTTTDDSLTYVSACDYWSLTHPAGSSNITVTLGWGTSSCDIKRLSTLRVGYWNGSEWVNLGQSANTGSTTTGTVKATTASSISTSAINFAISKHSPTPTASAGSATAICYGSSTGIGGSPTATGGFSPYTYSWSPATALSSSTVSNPTASPTATTTYTVTVNDNDNAPTATGTVVVTVDPQLIAVAGDDTLIDSTATITLGGSPSALGGTSPYTYLWHPSKFLNDTTIANPIMHGSGNWKAMRYSLQITDAKGCVSNSVMQVTNQQYAFLPNTFTLSGCGLNFVAGTVVLDERMQAPDLGNSYAGTNYNNVIGGYGVSQSGTGAELNNPVTNTHPIDIPTGSPIESAFVIFTVAGSDNINPSSTYNFTLTTPGGTITLTGNIDPNSGLAEFDQGDCWDGTTFWNYNTGENCEVDYVQYNYNITYFASVNSTNFNYITSGDYYISGLPTIDNTTCSCGTGICNNVADVDGATLFILYQDNTLLNKYGTFTMLWGQSPDYDGTTNGGGSYNVVGIVPITNIPGISVNGTAFLIASGVMSSNVQYDLNLNAPTDFGVLVPQTYMWNTIVANNQTLGNTNYPNETICTLYPDCPAGCDGISPPVHDCSSMIAAGAYYQQETPITITPSSSSICLGSHTDLTVSGGSGSYTWSPTTGLNPATGSSVTASPTETTTYIVTNGVYCASIVVTVNPLPIITPSSPSVCSGNSTTLTASGGTSYTWTSNPTGFSSTSATPSVSPTVTTVYTVTNQNGCSASVTVTVYNCCTPSTGGAAYFNYSSSALPTTTYISHSGTPPTIIGAVTVPAGQIVFNGIWTIDQDTKIENGSTIEFGQGAEIYINSGQTLTVDNSILTDCSEMWQGIVLADNTAHLIVETSSSPRSTIEEAQIAVESRGGGVYTITNSTLENNYIGIQCDAYLGTNESTINSSIVQGIALLDPPDHADYSALGMLITNVQDIYVGAASDGNTFNGLSCGIQILNSGVTIYNNTFEYMNRASSYTGEFSGIYDNCTISNTALVVGNDAASGINTFYDNTEYGVFVTGNVSPSIKADTFRYLRTGVVLDNLGSSGPSTTSSVYVNDNTMDHISYCGILGEYLKYTSTVQINNNSITASPAGTSEFGIYLLRTQWTNPHPTKTSTLKQVDNNIIESFLNGIQVTNSNNTSVVSNNISFTSTGTNAINGINNNGSTTCFIDENIITGHYAPGMYGVVPKSFGIYSTAPATGSNYRCNAMYNCSTGIEFYGAGNTTLLTVKSNYFIVANYGVVLDNSLIGAQGLVIPASPQYNKFEEVYSAYLYTINVDANNAANQWVYNGTSGPYYIPAAEDVSTPALYFAMRYFLASPTVKDSCTNLENIAELAPDSAITNIAVFDTVMARLVVQDSLNYKYNKAAASWMDKENLYSALITDTAIIGNAWKSDSVLHRFYDTVQSTNMGLIAQALNVLNTDTTIISGYYEGPAEANEYFGFSPSNIIEQNYQTVYSIYINYVLADSTLDSAQLANLQSIANQCPLTGGAAVFTARGLLAGVYSTPFDSLYSFYYDDSSLCATDTTDVFRMKINSQQPTPVISSFVTAFPNPAKDQITFVYQYSGTDNAILDIYDVLGTKMGEYTLAAAKGQYMMSLSNLSSGVYYYRLTTPCCEVGTGKFVLVK